MRILVTGGAGYIGSHTVRMLEQSAGQVVVFDNLAKGHRQAVGTENFVEGDLFDTELLAATIRKHEIDAVVHFAAFSLVGESMVQPRAYYHNNVQGTLNLLNTMLDNGVNKLVFSSTAAVYGAPAEVPITEACATNPTNVYGRTKLMMEHIMSDYATAHGLNYIALRYFNACGAHPYGDIGEDHDPETHLIPLILQTCMGRRDSIKIFGSDYPTKDGTCVRDYIHVDDLAQAHVLALQALNDGRPSTVYNLGNGCGFSVREVIAAAERVTKRPVRREEAARRPGDPAVLIAGSGKIRAELGWQPQYRDIERIIETAWQWHQHHPDGFDE